MTTAWEEFYAKTPKPSNLDENEKLLNQFIAFHAKENTKVVLVTSGGTTVPLEHNTVRFVDNFSAGSRGSISAENFLQRHYAVIFMYRVKSLEPFSRHFVGSRLLDMLELTTTNDTPSVSVTPQYVNKISDILKKYKDSLNQNMLLSISFTTLSEYLWLLRSACQALTVLENRAMLYLAAAVSDFYIPSNEMATHKIPSDEPPSVHLKLVPKVLEPLVKLWVPKAFVISFKLETDESILISKARGALRKYSHSLVIANMLQNRREQVVIVSKDNQETLSLTSKQLQNGEEIEKYIVDYLVEKHKDWLDTKL
ncbi:phosphopantothenate--cysteine ligase [Nasonia vitripennis]|uniref:DNA/pantothenate metabolism flavoprotein C-terminal domain-containing protein n=1 Tax=Nasonia vitripennis TaxID=7425 RepID=A0A7M7QD47_NASVI|nr:phosphopantothenate--cysteine ligase [Nasonia vitripennis]